MVNRVQDYRVCDPDRVQGLSLFLPIKGDYGLPVKSVRHLNAGSKNNRVRSESLTGQWCQLPFYWSIWSHKE